MNTLLISARGCLGALLAGLVGFATHRAYAQSLLNPVMFVTQVPVQQATNTVTSVGGNHLATTAAAPRGGDLMVRYPDGYLKNLTRAAGYGEAGNAQGSQSIAVRDPHIHWSGQRAIFSMVVGIESTARWQMYEITGTGRYDTPVITKILNQPAGYNNVQPCYTSSDTIIFVSDRPRDGSAHLYPAKDEKGQGEINTGLWQLNPVEGVLTLMEHSPSGSFDPFVDSYGRVVFSRWDHLQRDELTAGTNSAGGFDYTSEAPGATGAAGLWSDIHPEPLTSTPLEFGLKFDQFLPWTIHQDGTELVTINHLGRHEMTPGFTRSRPDSNLQDFAPPSGSVRAASFLQIRQASSGAPGRYVSTDAVFTAVSAGKIVTFLAPPSQSPASGASIVTLSGAGLARDPVVLTDGRIVTSLSNATNAPIGNSSYGQASGPPPPLPPTFIPGTSAPFRIRTAPGTPNWNSPATVDLTTAPMLIPGMGIVRSVTNTANGQAQAFSGTLWELQPVEVTSMTRPPATTTPMDRPELEAFTRAGVSPAVLRAWMATNNLAMISSRNVTARDAADKQQPTGLRAEGGVETIAPGGGPVYTVSSVKFFQADYVRAYGLTSADPIPDPGRRVTARPMHDDNGANPANAAGAGSVSVFPDGSIAAFVPARRGLSWHLSDPDGAAVVRERYWLSFQAGEIRSCTSCHGVNSVDQAGHGIASNPPEALRALLDSWKPQHTEAAAGNFRIWCEGVLGATLDPDADNDGDGVSNFTEYATGSSPLATPTAGTTDPPLSATRRTLGGQNFNTLTFRRSLTAIGLEMTVEVSDDMKSWSEAVFVGPSGQRHGETFDLTNSPVNEGQAEEIRITDLGKMAAGRRYYRLRMRSP